MVLGKISFLTKPKKLVTTNKGITKGRYYITIPRNYIRNQLLNPDLTYQITLIDSDFDSKKISLEKKQIINKIKAISSESSEVKSNIISFLKKYDNSNNSDDAIYFFAKPTKAGAHYSFTIPKIFIENFLISMNIRYRAYPKEVDKDTRELKDKLLGIVDKLDNNLNTEEIMNEIKNKF